MIDARVGRKRGARFLPVSGHDVERPRWEARLEDELPERQGRQGGLLGGLEHAAVAGGQGGRDRSGPDLERIVLRDDVAGYPIGLAERIDEEIVGDRNRVAIDALDGVRVELEVARSDLRVGGRLAQRLAGVHALELGERIAFAPDQLGRPPQNTGALCGGGAAPRFLECLARRADRLIDLPVAAARYMRDEPAARRIDVVKGLGHLHRPAADQGVTVFQR